MRLSVALATYNGAAFLRDQLDSLARQSRLPDELVVSDDGSDDGTADIVRAFGSTAPFEVRLLTDNPRPGVTGNFEHAARACTGDIVFFCDQDDVWHEDKIGRVEQAFASRPDIAVVMNDALLADASLRHQGRTQLGVMRASGFRGSFFVTGCCSAHRRDFQQLAFPIPAGHAAHDIWINEMAHRLGSVLVLGEALQTYRRHGANESQWLLSDPAGTGRLQLLAAAGLSDARQQWARNADRLKDIGQRLRDRPELAQRWTGRPLPDLLADLGKEEQAVRSRIALCSLPRRRRLPRVARLWAQGGYATQAGWMSALKDLVRP